LEKNSEFEARLLAMGCQLQDQCGFLLLSLQSLLRALPDQWLRRFDADRARSWNLAETRSTRTQE
jgi:hypothetical protein